MACEVTVSAIGVGWHESFSLVVSSFGAQVISWGGSDTAPMLGIGRRPGEPGQFRDILTAEFPLGEELSSVINLGTRIEFRMAASEAVARAHPRVSEYLDLRIERSADIVP